MDHAAQIAFVRAQLDAEERLAREVEGAWIPLGPNPADQRPIARLMALHSPTHVLRQVTARRAILDHIERELADTGGDNPWWYADRLAPVIQHLAAEYSDRDGYQSEWAAG